jgi:hypothetical protein
MFYESEKINLIRNKDSISQKRVLVAERVKGRLG